MKRLILFLALSVLPVAAQTINATSCSLAAVQTALNSIAANGTTVVIPSGSCTWTTELTFSTSFSFTLQGQSTVTSSDTHGNPTAFNDSTLITDGQANSGNNGPIFSLGLTGSSSQVVRMTGVSWHGGFAEFNGDIVFSGNSGTRLRIDHNHFINEANLAISFYQPMSGVVDHSLFDVPSGQLWNGVRVFYTADAQGDFPWNQPTNLGNQSYAYIENNTFNNGYVNDCEHGGTFVVRYNSLYWGAPSQNMGIQTHSTGSGDRGRGCRAFEIYNNWGGPKAGGDSLQFMFSYISSGTGVIYHNQVSNSDNGDIYLISNRDNNDTYPQTATPNGFGYCGSTFNGTASAWDGSTGAAGYLCLDQPGAGQGDLMSGYWPNVQDDSFPGVFTGHSLRQASEPIYIWKEVLTSVFNPITIHSPNNNIQANRDYYSDATSFNGTSGTGQGLLSARPATCTAGVAYFATDSGSQGTLYKCTATNTWTSFYQPLTYPHPLISGVTLTGTTTALSAASTTPIVGTSDLLTATVTSSSATGTVTFKDGGSSIGTCTLSAGTCPFTVTAITAGTHSYTATYGGDSTFASSTSSAVTVTVAAITIPAGLMPSGVALQ